jgi:transaldolase/glucose-6-phosphate isomerase
MGETMDLFEKLYKIGQSLWYDNIQRRLFKNGDLKRMIDEGEIWGVTSNPSIFNNAISKSNDYDDAIKPMAWAGWKAEEIFFQLAVEDIQDAADLFLPVYQKTGGGDGYVSLEVSPYLAKDAEGTLKQAKELWARVNRPNLMIKIPATIEGLDAIRKAIAAGININVTLIFSLERYKKVIDAYLNGLEDRLAQGLPVGAIHSVASFFISRVDSKVDPLLNAISSGKNGQADQLLGKAAIANARLAYAIFDEKFHSPKFEKLARAGANYQRPLWASTSTKNPAYPDLIYVEPLIIPHTVNTIPPQTLDAFRDHGKAKIGFDGTREIKTAQGVVDHLEELGISMAKVTDELEQEGVKAFADAFDALLKTIEIRSNEARNELGILRNDVPGWVLGLEMKQAAKRMYQKDASLWTKNPDGQAEIRKRLGWLDAPAQGLELQAELIALVSECQRLGYTRALVLGMGGSSMAPEVLASIFGVREREGTPGIEVSVLDSTNPTEVKSAARWSTIDRTLFIVSSKSGTTSEVIAYLDYFWERVSRRCGNNAGNYFVAITDPGTTLEKIARERGFLKVFAGNPQIGGRFSAISPFGLVPGALLGIDIGKFVENAEDFSKYCLPNVPSQRNPGLVLGAILGGAAMVGRDKLTLLADAEVSSFGAWLEQLVAESSGKEGKGILPVDVEPLVSVKEYAPDRLFIYLKMSGKYDDRARKLRSLGHPVLEMDMKDEYNLAGEFYRWETAISYACVMLGVNPFDQPDVQDNKTRTAQKIEQLRQTGVLKEEKPWFSDSDWDVFGSSLTGIEKNGGVGDIIQSFLKQVNPGDYVAINAYLPRNSKTISVLQKLRKRILQITGVATTLGFGPRFLHSTGQLHKGGANKGVFLQITSEPEMDVDIPGEGISFGILQKAQAIGDLEALAARGRRVIRLHMKNDGVSNLIRLLD